MHHSDKLDKIGLLSLSWRMKSKRESEVYREKEIEQCIERVWYL